MIPRLWCTAFLFLWVVDIGIPCLLFAVIDIIPVVPLTEVLSTKDAEVATSVFSKPCGRSIQISQSDTTSTENHQRLTIDYEMDFIL